MVNAAFTDEVLQSYQNITREEMPWRTDHRPYHVLLSEFMLQQTQVSRVIRYFTEFINRWPTLELFADATLSHVVSCWQGLGYNRRAKYLWESARIIVHDYNGIIPQKISTLKMLPGIGEYTSAAIMVFAYNKPEIMVETNIRRAILYCFFKHEQDVSEHKVREKVAETLYKKNPRMWYWALMDYGALLTKKVVNPNRKSKIYKKQSQFIGSNRQVRGAIIRTLTKHARLSVNDIVNMISNEVDTTLFVDAPQKFDAIVKYNMESLKKEGLLVQEETIYYIP